MEIKNRTLSNFAELVRTGECKKFKGRLKKRMQRVIALGTGDLVENHDISLDENRVGRFYPILRRAVGKTVSDGLK